MKSFFYIGLLKRCSLEKAATPRSLLTAYSQELAAWRSFVVGSRGIA
jgi:hypothetical protein